jgi:hypothetical protein
MMAILKIVYTEEDRSVQLYRDCDVEAVCRSWLHKCLDCKDTSFIFQLTTAQELVLFTMQALLCTDEYQLLTRDNILFYVEDFLCTFDDKWRLDPYPSCFPSYEGRCLDLIWGL